MKKSILLIVCILVSSLPLIAQKVGINTLTPLTRFHVDLGDSLSNGVLFTGLQSTGGSFPSLGPGRRLMFYPGNGSFRAGYVNGTQWDEGQVGLYSFASGFSTIARGDGSTSMGVENIAGGTISTAFGYRTIAKGYASLVAGMYNDSLIVADEFFPNAGSPLFIIGNGTDHATRNNAFAIFKNGNLLLKNPTTVLVEAGGLFAPAIGAGTRMMWLPQKSAFRAGTVDNNNWDIDSIGTWSTAIGLSTKAKGRYSTAMGVQTTASGITSTAMGYATKASGENSVSMGSGSIASGPVATAMGYFTSATGYASSALGVSTSARSYASAAIGHGSVSKGYGSLALGVFNDPILAIDEEAVNATTPLLIIGNGDNELIRRNAMVVRKDGHVGIGTSAPETFLHVDVGTRLRDGMVVEGVYSMDATLPNHGSGSRIMYYPGKGIFRAGSVSGTQWDDIGSGKFSVGFGQNTKASGEYSFASGYQSFASGLGAFALGLSNDASHEAAVALGSNTKAKGAASVALGNYTIAKSLCETVVGRFNDTLLVTAPNPVSWEADDALFIAGNGVSSGARSNAFVVYKNANTDIKGFTHLGNNSPNVKMKKLTGVSASSQNTWTNVAHGLTQTKILSVDIIMIVPGFVNIPPSYTYQPGYEFHYQIATSDIVVINSATNSSNILSKAFTVLIVYEE